VYMLAQCEGDLGDSDCGDCVKSVVQRAQVECGSSISGQVYLHKCFISYNYYPNGVPKRSSSSGKVNIFLPLKMEYLLVYGMGLFCFVLIPSEISG
jgi:hypothetical protein